MLRVLEQQLEPMCSSTQLLEMQISFGFLNLAQHQVAQAQVAQAQVVQAQAVQAHQVLQAQVVQAQQVQEHIAFLLVTEKLIFHHIQERQLQSLPLP